MSLKSKRVITSMAVGIGFTIAYICYGLRKYSAGPASLQSWALGVLVLSGIGVAAMIIIQILFHIAASISIAVKEQGCDEKTVERIVSSSMVEDEMDKLISLKAARVGYICFGIGFAAAIAALAFGLSALFALHIQFGAVAIGNLAEGGVSICYYERGIRHG